MHNWTKSENFGDWVKFQWISYLGQEQLPLHKCQIFSDQVQPAVSSKQASWRCLPPLHDDTTLSIPHRSCRAVSTSNFISHCNTRLRLRFDLADFQVAISVIAPMLVRSEADTFCACSALFSWCATRFRWPGSAAMTKCTGLFDNPIRVWVVARGQLSARN